MNDDILFLIDMKFSPVLDRVNKMDPIQSKMYLSDFTSPIKKSRMSSRESEGEN
jgi:hypothetical protein